MMDEWTLNDLLECSVCLERLDTSSKVLPCQHTFCKKCLEEIVHTHKELRCPECRVLVEIGIDDLPPNVLLMRILEGMRNAPRRTSADVHLNQSETMTSANNSELTVTFSSHTRVRSKSANRPRIHQLPDLHQPYAIAKCDCITKEPGDLSFKRGDVILLRRRIEHNWYQGECNGVLGVFPLSYVHVIVPLPSHIPQCKALYDFGKYHEDDEGCLHFSKDDIITVIRRIDENWAEGKLDDRIGIFPISFVEMNFLAKNLMKTSFSSSTGSSRDAPPTPTNESAPLISNDGSNFACSSPSQNTSENLISSLSPSSSSSSSTSTATTSPTSSSESTTPSSPSTSPSAGQPAQSLSVKRHSYTLGAQPPPYLAPPAVHRHSAEILKVEENTVELPENEQRYHLEPRTTQPKPLQSHFTSSQGDETPSRQPYHRKKIQADPLDLSREPQTICLPAKTINGNSNFHRQSSLRISKTSGMHFKFIDPPSLPAMYIAIYPYKPQKTDELELKIGNVYTVIERCQDGWFKGTSHPNQKCGVFPGNYVTPVKSLPVLQAQLRGLMQNSTSPRHDVRACSEVRVPPAATKSNVMTPVTNACSNNENNSRLAPPDLPARSASPVLLSTTSQKVSATVWHVPNTDMSEKTTSITSSVMKHRVRNENPESNGHSLSSVSVSQKTNEIKMPTFTDKSKEKKEKCSVSLMRRLTSMKKSRSPPPTTSYSIDNPVFEDGGSAATFVPVAHARSDSCPSQLLYNIQPHVTVTTNNPTNVLGGSQRIKQKQRSSLQNQLSRTYENNVSTAFPTNTKTNKEEKPVISHRKSSSLDTTVYDERQMQKSKIIDPPPRERYRCIAPYPPNSEFELELRVGDIIYVHKKRDDGWYKGTLQRNGRTGLFPASFVESI